MLPQGSQWVSDSIRVYSDDELRKIFEVASDHHRMCWKTLRLSGVVAYLAW